MDSLIKVENIYKDFFLDGKKQSVLEDISFEVEKGDFVCLIGPSGCGKSTLLRIIANLIKPSSGAVSLSSKLKLSMVFQNFALFPWLTVKENISFGLHVRGDSQDTINSVADRLVDEMGLSGFEDKHIKELSGGMKQRVGIARALAMEPDILLLDEPFSALDIFTANKLRDDLLKIWKKNNLTIIMVSHLIEEAIQLADKIVVLSSGPGKIKEVRKIDLARPRNARTESFYNYVDELQKMIIV